MLNVFLIGDDCTFIKEVLKVTYLDHCQWQESTDTGVSMLSLCRLGVRIYEASALNQVNIIISKIFLFLTPFSVN